jgi:phage protein D
MTTTGAQSSYYAARPMLRIDGQLQQSLGDAELQSLLVEETTLGLFRCEASFLNWGPRRGEVGFTYFDRQMLDFGKVFSVEFGPPGADNPVFAGRISGIEAHYPPGRPPEIQILAEDRLQDLRMERHTRSFENVTDADVVRRIAGQHGLTAQVDITGPTYRALAQFNQSDLAFLRERMAAVDAELWIDDRTLYAQARARRSAGSVSFTYGKELLEFSVLADLADQRTAVKVSGWNVGAKEAIEVEVGENAISAELNGGRSGGGLLAQALAQRRESVALVMPLSQAEARQMAEARYRHRARGFIRGSGLVDGNVKIRVGATVNLLGLGPLFEGAYYVTVARHTFTLDEGYRTAFEVERAGLGG